jgi:hypothetical protein
MPKAVLAVLIALALGAPSAFAETKLKPRAPPSSYAPAPHSGPHVYGSPIGPPIVGRARPAHQAHAAARQPAAPGTHTTTVKHRPAAHAPS